MISGLIMMYRDEAGRKRCPLKKYHDCYEIAGRKDGKIAKVGRQWLRNETLFWTWQ